MKIDVTGWAPTIDAHDLDGLYDIPPAEMHALMRAGTITTRFETGADEDAGKFRLTILRKTCRGRLTCSEDGTVQKAAHVTLEQR